jgi:hypothetical protein
MVSADVGLQGINAVWTGRYMRFGGTYCLHLQGFSNVYEPIRIYKPVLRKKVVCLYETLTSTYKSTRRYNPEDQHRYISILFDVSCVVYT